jgi:RHS repeat-associated protein
MGSYVAAPSSHVLRSGGRTVGASQIAYDDGSGRTTFPRGLLLSSDEPAAVTTVFNEGTPYRLESPPAPIRFRQDLITGIGAARRAELAGGIDAARLIAGRFPATIELTTEIDVPAAYVCSNDSTLLFSLARQARVTVEFLPIDDTGNVVPLAFWTPIGNEIRNEGVHQVDVPIDRLPFGEYVARVRAQAVVDGEQDQRMITAVHREDRADALPLAHTFVKGVNVFNGGAVIAVQDVDLGGVGPPVSLERTYSSDRGDRLGVFGRGWSSNLESRVRESSCGTLTVIGGAGQGQRFERDRVEPDGSVLWRPLGGYNGLVVERFGAYDFYAKDGTRYRYAEPSVGARRLSFIEDPNGNRMMLEYAQRGETREVIALKDDDGRSVSLYHELRTFEQTVNGVARQQRQWVVTAALAPGELVLRFDYDTNGNLSRVRRPQGLREETYGYLDIGGVFIVTAPDRVVYHHLGYRLVAARDALNGAERAYTHTKLGVTLAGMLTYPLAATRVVSVREPDGGTTGFDYTREVGQPPATVVTDARNHPTRYEMNAYGAVEVQVDPAGTTRTAWDLQRWQPAAVTDANGRVTSYAYDAWGNRTLEQIALDGRTIERRWTFWPPETFERPGIKNREHMATDGRDIVTTTTWDARGNAATRERGGVTESWAWSTRGLMDRRTDGFGATWTYGWDASGFPRTRTAPEGGVTQWVYDARGRKTRETDANQRVTDFEYDQRDRLRRVLHPVIDDERAEEGFDYDDRDNTVTRIDARGATTIQSFDDMGRLLSEIQATGETRNFEYDPNGNRTSETDFRGNSTTLRYDAANRLERREAPMGRNVVHEYDAVGNVTAETVSGGDQPARRTEYRYRHPLYRRTLTRRQLGVDWLETAETHDDNGNRTSLTDAEGRAATFQYDDRDRLVAERRPLGHLIEYAYDGADRRIRETRNNPAPGSGAQVRTWRYDGDGRLREQVDAEANATTFDYDPRGNRIAQTNARGAVRRWRYDARDRVIVEEGPVAGWRVTYALDPNGNRIGETQPTVPTANQIVRTFDPLNRLVRVEDGIGLVEAIGYNADGHVTSRTNANDRTTTFVIDALGRVEREERPLGRVWTRTWTVHGELRSETDPRNFVTRHEYDSTGRRTATILPPRDGGTGDDRLRWTYDGVGNVLTQIDARGNTTTFEYDELHRRKNESVAGVAVDGELGLVTRSWTYDTVGNVLTETDRRGTITTSTWDRENRRKTATRDGTLVERTDYDAVGNIKQRADANGTVTRTEYDLADRPEEQVAGDGTAVAATTVWTYTPLGDVLTVTDPELRTTTQDWDRRRRLVRVQNAEGEVTRYTHDGLGQIRRIVPPKGETHASTRDYDLADRLRTVTDGADNTWTYGYNTTDQRTSITNPRGHATTFDYDGRGLLRAMTYPGGTATWTYRHDADGHRIRETSPDNVTREYLVDALGRRRAATYTPAAGGEPMSTRWTYDPNGNLRTVEDRFATGDPLRMTRTWDRRDRIASETDPHGRTLRYTYDPHGNRLLRIDEAAGETTTYTWDARQRNTSVSSPSSGTTNLTWYRDDRQHTITRPGNVLSTTTWDRAGRVAGIVHVANGTPVVTLAYGYDLNGNRASETLTHAGQPPIASTYTHDEADRLQSMTVDGITTTYTLDGAGNRTGERTAVDGQPATRNRSCTFDARDRIAGCTDAATGVTETYAWDATGRMTQETIGGLTRTHAWDARDRLLRLEEVAGPTTTYKYDPEGLRIETRQGAAGERVQYDAGHRHAETNGAGNVTRTYQATAPHRATSRGAWARAGAAAMTLFLGLTDAGAIPTQRHYLHDAHGTPVAITTEAGAIAQRSAYDVWGNPTRVETLDAGLQANPNRIGFTGYVLDLEGSRVGSGASASANNPIANAGYYAKARYYGAGRGGFLSVDPWDGDTNTPVSLNKYLYGYANPGVYVDPDGRITILDRDARGLVNRAGEASLGMSERAAAAMRDAPWHLKPALAAQWVAGGTGYIASGAGDFAVLGANLIANAVVAGTDMVGDAVGVQETALSGLAREAYAETDALVAEAAPIIQAFRDDPTGTSSAVIVEAIEGVGAELGAASDGDSQAIFNLASNISPGQLWRNGHDRLRHAVNNRNVGAPSPVFVAEGGDGTAVSASRSSEIEHPALTAQRSLAMLAQETRELFVREPNALARYLRQGEIDEIRKNPWRIRLFFGTAVERRVADVARDSDDLASLKHTRSNAPQDFVGLGNYGYDITGSSETSIRSHFARDGVDAVVTYDSIPNDFGIEWLKRVDQDLDDIK